MKFLLLSGLIIQTKSLKRNPLLKIILWIFLMITIYLSCILLLLLVGIQGMIPIKRQFYLPFKFLTTIPLAS